jgi:hypothetical protein
VTTMSTDRHVAHTADLAPATVTGYSTGEIAGYRRRRDRQGRWVDAVVRSQIDDRLLAGALEAAGGDANRLWFGADGAVWILNHQRGQTCPSPACPACHPK